MKNEIPVVVVDTKIPAWNAEQNTDDFVHQYQNEKAHLWSNKEYEFSTAEVLKDTILNQKNKNNYNELPEPPNSKFSIGWQFCQTSLFILIILIYFF